MGKNYVFIFLFVMIGLGLATYTTSFAEKSVINISIPPGSSSLGCEETDECYIPAKVIVDVGERVTWTFDDSAAHTITSGTQSDGNSIGTLFDSGLLLPDSTFSHIFSEVGTVDYFCVVHPWMKGIVIVQESVINKQDDIDDKKDYVEKEIKPIIEFDYDEYIVGDGAFITLFDSNENLNSLQKDTVNVQINSESSPGFMIKLTETSPNNGIFVNKKLLKFTTGPTNEINQELNVDLEVGNIVSLTHNESSDTAIIYGPGVSGVQATADNHVTFNKNSFEIDVTVGTVSIFDPDKNHNPNKIQRFDVTLDSIDPALGSVKESITLRMLEKSVDNDEFRSKHFLHFTSGPTDPNTYYLHVENGDTVRITHQSLTYGAVEFATAAITGTPIDEPPTSIVNVDFTEALTCPGGDDPQDGICAVWMPASPLDGLDIIVNGISYERICTPLLVDTAGQYVDLGTGYTTNNVCPSPNSLDVFLEIDYMTGHKPSQQAVEDVIEVFANAPEPINLHVTVDEDVGFRERIRIFPSENPGPNPTPTYFEIKDAFFGTFDERQSPNVDDTLTAKRQVFHYGMFIHKYAECNTCSGFGDNANDFVVSLGAWAGMDANGDGGIGSTRQQSGTLLHELGHNFDLRHGGNQNINCKPNYISSMSYTYQFPEFGLDLLDYSHSKLPTLDETNLDENDGIGESDPTGLDTVIGDDVLMPEAVATGAPINWDGLGDMTDTGVSRNINFLSGVPGCEKDTVDSNMAGRNDWVNLQFVSRAQSHFSDGIAIKPESTLPELLPTIVQQSKLPAPDVDRITPNAKPQNIIISHLDNVPITLIGSTPFGKQITSFEIIGTTFGGTLEPITPTNDPNVATTTFVPDQTFDRKGSFDFIVTTNVDGQTIQSMPSSISIILNNPPIAHPQNVITSQDSELVIELEGTDIEGDLLEFFADDTESSGYLSSITDISSNTAQVTYVPDLGFVGTDMFVFGVSDGTESSKFATVSVEVQSAEPSQDQSAETSQIEEEGWPNESTIKWILGVIALTIIGLILLLIRRT